MSHPTTENTWGPGTYCDQTFIPVPQDAKRLLTHLADITPGFTKDQKALEDVQFVGQDLPLLPGPLKAQVLSAVLHAMIGIAGKELLAMKGIKVDKIAIDTDHAAMYPATAALISINNKTMAAEDRALYKMGKDLDKNCMHSNAMRHRGWAIYPTRDPNVWYQIMFAFSPYTFFKAYGLDADAPLATLDEAYDHIKSVISKYSARELEQKNMENGFCGQTCFTPEQWRETLMGKIIARRPFIDYIQVLGTATLPPTPLPIVSGDQRPLAGIKVVELARVIATPALCAVLTSLGAEVVKVQSPNLPDPNVLQLSLTVGKYTCSLDLTLEPDRQKLHGLLEGADVVVQAFRLKSLERKGFGLADIVEMARKRNKGVVFVDLNCYGQEGTYAERPGFQQIADAASGCSYVMGKAYGLEEGTGVLPSLPIADMLTGAAGAVEVMLALRDRAKHGGSYHASSVLVSSDTLQLSPEFGLYQPEVVEKIRATYNFPKMTPELHGEETLALIYKTWSSNTDLLQRKQYFTKFTDSPFGKDHTILAPIARFEGNELSSPHWSHSPRPYCEHTEVGWGLAL